MLAAACAHKAWPERYSAVVQSATLMLHAEQDSHEGRTDTAEVGIPDWLFQQKAAIDLAASPWAACTAELQCWDCQLEECPATRGYQALACQCPKQPHLCGWWALQLPCRSMLGAQAFYKRGEPTAAPIWRAVLCACRIVSYKVRSDTESKTWDSKPGVVACKYSGHPFP